MKPTISRPNMTRTAFILQNKSGQSLPSVLFVHQPTPDDLSCRGRQVNPRVTKGENLRPPQQRIAAALPSTPDRLAAPVSHELRVRLPDNRLPRNPGKQSTPEGAKVSDSKSRCQRHSQPNALRERHDVPAPATRIDEKYDALLCEHKE